MKPSMSPRNEGLIIRQNFAMIQILLIGLTKFNPALDRQSIQSIQKTEEESESQDNNKAKDRSWKIPICYDDDEDNIIAITPVLPIEEPDNSLSMGDEHLDTIPETESDKVIKSSVEDLFPPTDRSDFNHEEFADELTHIMSLPELECFKFKIEPDPGDLTSIDLGMRKNAFYTNVMYHLRRQSSLFDYVVSIFLAFSLDPVVPPYHLSTNEIPFLIPAFPFIILLCRMYLIEWRLFIINVYQTLE
ncbi:hypothetical protein Tco_0462794 [Tanacetum coccineum]